MGVSKAAARISVGVYVHGLSCRPGPDGVVQVAVAVLVVIFSSFVQDTFRRVKVWVLVVVTAFGVTVLVRFAVAEGMVVVVKGPTVDTIVLVVVEVNVTVGVEVIVKVTVGVVVVVACGPTSRYMSEQIIRHWGERHNQRGPTSLPGEWVPIIIVAQHKYHPFSREHLALEDRARREPVETSI